MAEHDSILEVAATATPHGSLDSAVQALREGVDDGVLKPVRVGELWRTVGEALVRRPQGGTKRSGT